MLIELLFIAENFQCGPTAPLAQFEIVVTESQGLGIVTHHLRVGDSLLIDEEKLGTITVKPVANANCASVYTYKEATPNNIPNLPGLYNQPDVAFYLNQLQGAESIYLYEFGSITKGDYQDVILKIDWDHKEKNIYAD